jgi:hypothetical protein
MRQVHLGKRLDDSMLYSNRTYELDARTTVSALRDVIESQLDAESLKRRMEAIRHANDRAVEPQQAKDLFRKLLQKGESEAATQAFESSDTYHLPAGNTNWRMSNAISWIAESLSLLPLKVCCQHNYNGPNTIQIIQIRLYRSSNGRRNRAATST